MIRSMSSFLINAGVKCKLPYFGERFHKFKSFRWISTVKSNTSEEKEESNPSKETAYHPSIVEAKLYEVWESRNYFKPHKSEIDSYVILLPPPNITGTLHLGHALTCTIQDVLLRWKRMKGESVLWIPGIDHAGIATQVAVEKKLKQSSGLSRHDLGREEFLKMMWKWKKEKKGKIIEQIRKLGASVDWSKLIFTMDSSHSQLVTKSFIQLFNDGLIYRRESLVNWSCALQSSISDIEVDWVTIDNKTSFIVPGYEKPVTFGLIYDIAYKVCDEDDEIVISTTRPETILGDVAIAIHPDNAALAKYQNKYVWHPFRNEKIPIIVDEFVQSDFGTGAVKITPSHSLTDFEVGQKHKLRSIPVINECGFINKVGTNEKFHGLKRFDARWAIIAELKKLNLFRNSKPHSMTIPVCSRSGDIIELIEKKQWFLKCDTLSEKAVSAVKNGDLKITPECYKNSWYDWLCTKPSRDWNLSRQLYWGHQIPMYECQLGEKTVWVASSSPEEARSEASEKFGVSCEDIKVTQDPDVLDTWFSSGLLSLNAMLNQEKKPPISLMVTGHDILFFWLARMVMLSLQLTGELPFKDVFLHALVCDSSGKKMSKSIGNVIHVDDVIHGLKSSQMQSRLEESLLKKEITHENFKKTLAHQRIHFPNGIPECGVDALRLSLCSRDIQGYSLNFDVAVCQANKFFGNKIYQAFNYFLKITDVYKTKREEFDLEDIKKEREKLNCFDLWILSKLAELVELVDKSLSCWEFEKATKKLKFFIINEFCNFYLTSTKPLLENCSPDQYKTTVSVFFHCFETSLRLLCPFMPFLTDYLYQELPSLKGFEKRESITVAKFPDPRYWSEFRDTELEAKIEKISDFLTDLRGTKIMFNMKSERPKVWIKCSDDVGEFLLGDLQHVFSKLGEVKEFSRIENLERSNVIQIDVEGFTALMEHSFVEITMRNLFGSIIDQERQLLQRLEKLEKITKTPEWQEKLPTEKLKETKQINNIKTDLKKINKYKLAINACDR